MFYYKMKNLIITYNYKIKLEYYKIKYFLTILDFFIFKKKEIRKNICIQSV